jgi:hypothetical protein
MPLYSAGIGCTFRTSCASARASDLASAAYTEQVALSQTFDVGFCGVPAANQGEVAPREALFLSWLARMADHSRDPTCPRPSSVKGF